MPKGGDKRTQFGVAMVPADAVKAGIQKRSKSAGEKFAQKLIKGINKAIREGEQVQPEEITQLIQERSLDQLEINEAILFVSQCVPLLRTELESAKTNNNTQLVETYEHAIFQTELFTREKQNEAIEEIAVSKAVKKTRQHQQSKSLLSASQTGNHESVHFRLRLRPGRVEFINNGSVRNSTFSEAENVAAKIILLKLFQENFPKAPWYCVNGFSERAKLESEIISYLNDNIEELPSINAETELNYKGVEVDVLITKINELKDAAENSVQDKDYLTKDIPSFINEFTEAKNAVDTNQFSKLIELINKYASEADKAVMLPIYPGSVAGENTL